jgi:hypothetical protein
MAARPTNAINVTTTTSGLVNFDGTSAFSTTGLTQYNVLVGASANTIQSEAPGATAGVPLCSNGSSAYPTFTKALVAGGGTGNATQAAYSIVCGGTTTTGAFQAVNPVAAGPILRAGGTTSLPAWTTTTYPATNAISTLLYASAANVMSALATANSGVLATSSTGVPSIDTTNFAVLSTGLQLKGNNTNTTPPSGFIGEHIQSVIGSGSAVSVATATAQNITTITLTAGIWDITGILVYQGITTGVGVECIISTSTSGSGTLGDSATELPISSLSSYSATVIVPAYRVLLNASTNYYLNAFCNYTVGSATAYGRLSAVRAG